MKIRRFGILAPLLFMLLGMAGLFLAQREFRSMAQRNDASLHADLLEAGLPRPQVAALVAAQMRLESNAASYTQLAAFFVLIISIFMSIPLYTHLVAGRHSEPNKDALEVRPHQ